ncbi:MULTISPECIES: hypothetical protein [Pseudomonas syringae group]|uniref:hypothetical protein n=1 Tax=Pseudomonas syringae group TaxID=136849 RepID=UPI000291AD3A|nr:MULTISPECIES: hypothetical protein [Pseudomonas syringae group]EKN46720.1 hypothetical protein AAI_10511 [Pseudomonas viridiflava UASWS0038]KPL64836.1 hypothetical protein PVFL_10035 [Pseudomonas viridiflava]MBI6701866.1 hypothetical protein [Pseudomonas viridiflava]MBI6722278.1 hypothetical protein [Pseudomonas viridiflava]OAG90988.1 hypothetical protein AO065_15255 [Pseudomonas viridiflava]
MTRLIGIGMMVAVCGWPLTAAAVGQLPGNMQIVMGDCNLVVNVAEGQALKVPPKPCTQLSTVKGMADAVIKIERFLEVTNPTEIKLSSVDMERWGGDEEEYLTLTLSNVSALPAEKLRIQLYAPVRQGEKTSRKLTFAASQALPRRSLSQLSLASRTTTKVPVAPLSGLLSLSFNRIPPGYELLGAGTSPNIPEDVRQRILDKHHIQGGYDLKMATSSLGVEVKYTTIFDGSVSLLSGIYLYFGQVKPVPSLNNL